MTLSINLESTCGLKPITVLGKGADGIVIKALNIKTKKHCAVKIVSIVDNKLKFFEREAMNTFRLQNHSTILSTKGFHKLTEEFGMIVMEFFASGDLMSYFLSQKTLSEKKIIQLFKKMCEAVHHCHEHNIAHLDIKPENFLYDKLTGDMKLCDFFRSFDCVNDREDWEVLNGLTSLKYRAPEMFSNKRSRNDLLKTDIWALGISLFGLFFSFFPFNEADDALDFDFAKLTSMLADSNLSCAAQSLLLDLLNPNPSLRPSISEVLLHPLFNNH